MGDSRFRSIDRLAQGSSSATASQERVVGIFTDIARRYERFNHVSSFGLDRCWIKALVRLAPIKPDSRVLDIAGGTGEVAFSICRAKPCERIVLSDITPAMLEVARDRMNRGDSCKVGMDICVADAQRLPFESESFDVVTMAYGIRNMPDRVAALGEANRVLVSGGTACILEFSQPENRLARLVHNAYLKHGIPLVGRLCAGHREDFEYLCDSILAFPDRDAFSSMLLDAGFSQIFRKSLTMGTVTIFVAKK